MIIIVFNTPIAYKAMYRKILLYTLTRGAYIHWIVIFFYKFFKFQFFIWFCRLCLFESRNNEEESNADEEDRHESEVGIEFFIRIHEKVLHDEKACKHNKVNIKFEIAFRDLGSYMNTVNEKADAIPP